jgi:multisubunit Na+/H+ antiporter MnhF subunit
MNQFLHAIFMTVVLSLFLQVFQVSSSPKMANRTIELATTQHYNQLNTITLMILLICSHSEHRYMSKCLNTINL